MEIVALAHLALVRLVAHLFAIGSPKLPTLQKLGEIFQLSQFLSNFELFPKTLSFKECSHRTQDAYGAFPFGAIREANCLLLGLSDAKETDTLNDIRIGNSRH